MRKPQGTITGNNGHIVKAKRVQPLLRDCGQGFVALNRIHAPRELGFKPLDHVELAEKLDLIDFEGGARTTGHGFYFLKNEAVLLELALQRYAVGLLMAEGFTPVITPDLSANNLL